MNRDQLLALIGRVGLKAGGGIIIGLWIAVQFPDAVKTLFQSANTSGVVGLAAMLFGVYQSVQNQNKQPPAIDNNNGVNK